MSCNKLKCCAPPPFLSKTIQGFVSICYIIWLKISDKSKVHYFLSLLYLQNTIQLKLFELLNKC